MFALPTGVTIDPESEPLVFAIEGDRQPIGTMTLAASSLVSTAGERASRTRTATRDSLSVTRVAAIGSRPISTASTWRRSIPPTRHGS